MFIKIVEFIVWFLYAGMLYLISFNSGMFNMLRRRIANETKTPIYKVMIGTIIDIGVSSVLAFMFMKIVVSMAYASNLTLIISLVLNFYFLRFLLRTHMKTQG